MFKGVVRLVARVRAVLAQHWAGTPGQRFRETLSKATEGQDVSTIVGEGTKRYAVGKISREYAAVEENFAHAEAMRIDTELAKRTLEDIERQQRAKADQEETRARIMRSEEILGRLKLFDEFRKCDALPVWDDKGNMRIVKASATFDWEAQRAKVLAGDEPSRPAKTFPTQDVVVELTGAAAIAFVGEIVAVKTEPTRSDESE